jgi:hypothetical protein
MSHIASSSMPHAYDKSGVANDAQADDGGDTLVASIEAKAVAARDAISNVPTKTWTIGAIVAGVAASVAIGAIFMGGRKTPSRSSRTARKGSARPRASTARRAKAA